MPKYYVRDGQERAIVDAVDGVSACMNAVLTKFNSFMVNGHYWVSERGFEPHAADDLKIESNVINEIFSRRFGVDFKALIEYLDEQENNPKNSQDGP